MIHKTYVENHMMLLTVESVKHCCIHHTHTCLIGLMMNSNQPKHAAIHLFYLLSITSLYHVGNKKYRT